MSTGFAPPAHTTGDHSQEAPDYTILVGVRNAMQRILTTDGYFFSAQDINFEHVNVDYDNDSGCPGQLPAINVNSGTTEYKDLLAFEIEGTLTFPIIGIVYSKTSVDQALYRLQYDVFRALYVEKNNGYPFFDEVLAPNAVSIRNLRILRSVTDEQFLAPYGQFVLTVQVEFSFYSNLVKP